MSRVAFAEIAPGKRPRISDIGPVVVGSIRSESDQQAVWAAVADPNNPPPRVYPVGTYDIADKLPGLFGIIRRVALFAKEQLVISETRAATPTKEESTAGAVRLTYSPIGRRLTLWQERVEKELAQLPVPIQLPQEPYAGEKKEGDINLMLNRNTPVVLTKTRRARSVAEFLVEGLIVTEATGMIYTTE